MPQQKLWTPEFIGMGLTNFFYFMSQYILIAVLPVFIMDDLGDGQLAAGMAMTCFQIGTVCTRPIAGRIIDGVNKQKLLLISTVFFVLIMGGFLLASNLHMVYGLRLVHGIVFAIGTTASAAMAALVLPAKRKGEGIGYFAVSGNMAMVIGPLVGLLIIGWFGSKMLFGFLCLLAISAVIAGNRKRLPDDVVKPSGEKKKGIHVSDFFEKKALPFVILGGLVFFAIVIVVTRPFVGYLFDYHGPDYTVYPGFGLFALGFILFSQAHSPFTLLFSGTILGVGFGALAPAFQTLAVQSAPAARAGVATSTYFWSLDTSVGLAAAILGAVAGSEGYPFMYGVVCLASALAGLAYYFFWRKTSGKRVMKRAAVEA